MTRDIVMVHGAFCGGWVFDSFRRPFEAAGFAVSAPDLRGHSGPGARSVVSTASMADYAADIAKVVADCDLPPILVGHSLGGLVAQLAAAKAPVAALVLLAPSAPWGIMGGSMEEAVSAMGLFGLGAFWSQAVDPDYSLAEMYSLNRVGMTERRAVFDRMTPESGKALWETLNWWQDPFMTTNVNAGRIGAPVLAIAGGRDLIHPAATVKQTAARLGGDITTFTDMSHWLIGEPGWEDVAQTCLDWLAEETRQAA